ncbi:uncharacterized protein A4U43_C07F32450, partial [Asparagus officinalis]
GFDGIGDQDSLVLPSADETVQHDLMHLLMGRAKRDQIMLAASATYDAQSDGIGNLKNKNENRKEEERGGGEEKVKGRGRGGEIL